MQNMIPLPVTFVSTPVEVLPLQSPNTRQTRTAICPRAATSAPPNHEILGHLWRGRFPALLATIAGAVSACAPIQDPAHPDQCPDVNYSVTAVKDAQQIGSIAAIDVEVTSRMAGKFPGCAIAIVEGDEIVYMKGYGFSHFNVSSLPPILVPFTTTTTSTRTSATRFSAR